MDGLNEYNTINSKNIIISIFRKKKFLILCFICLENYLDNFTVI